MYADCIQDTVQRHIHIRSLTGGSNTYTHGHSRVATTHTRSLSGGNNTYTRSLSGGNNTCSKVTLGWQQHIHARSLTGGNTYTHTVTHGWQHIYTRSPSGLISLGPLLWCATFAPHLIVLSHLSLKLRRILACVCVLLMCAPVPCFLLSPVTSRPLLFALVHSSHSLLVLCCPCGGIANGLA